MTRGQRFRRGAAAVVVGWVVLSGCGGPPAVGEHTAGPPSGSVGPLARGVDAVGVDAAGRIVIVTWGSSTCPELPVRVGLGDGGRLQVTTAPGGTGDCTLDVAATTSTVPPPAGFERSTADTALVNGTETPLLSY